MKALVVDGYNAVHKIPRIGKLADKSLLEARNAVTKLARQYKARCGGVDKTYVVFDGKDEYRFQHQAGLPEQVFSRTGEGDRKIIKVVSELSSQYHVIVVSDDNFVINNSRAYNATVISVSEFLKVAEKKSAQKKKTDADKLPDGDISIINEELRRHWKV